MAGMSKAVTIGLASIVLSIFGVLVLALRIMPPLTTAFVSYGLFVAAVLAAIANDFAERRRFPSPLFVLGMLVVAAGGVIWFKWVQSAGTMF